jgi:hypothetical protein
MMVVAVCVLGWLCVLFLFFLEFGIVISVASLGRDFFGIWEFGI